jgi:succinoglycan biosynthesis protein ExoO
MSEVSVVIAAYNCRSTLGRAIESAQRQTLRDIEIVVVDDGSVDGTFEFAQSFTASDPRIKCLRLAQNSGVSTARNAAIGIATGEWIAILDADDRYEPERLETMLKAAHDLGADVVCDNLKIYDHMREEIVDQTQHGGKDRATPLTPEFLFRRDTPLHLHAIGYLKPMMRKKFLQAHSITYNVKYRAGEDFYLLAEVVLNGGCAFLIPGAFYVYVHRISPTTRKISPHSRSEAGFALTVEGCDELIRVYGASMTSQARQALQQRRWIFESRIMCGDMLAALRQKRFVAAFGILLARPFIMVLIGTTAAKLVYANLLTCRQRLKKIGAG